MGAVLAPRLPRPPGIHALLQRGVSRRIKRCVCCIRAQRLPSEVPFYLLTCGINIIGSLVRSHQLMVYDVSNIPYCQKPKIEAGRFLLEVQIAQSPIAIFHFASYMYISPDILNKKSLSLLSRCLKVYFLSILYFFQHLKNCGKTYMKLTILMTFKCTAQWH